MNRPKAATISVEDGLAIIQLIGEVAVLNGGAADQKHFLMDGICKIIDAQSWLWADVSKFEPDEPPVYTGFLNGGFTPRQFTKFIESCEHPDMAVVNQGVTREFAKKRKHLTRLREQIIENEKHFLASEAHKLWAAAGVEQVIMSIRPDKESGQMVGTAFYRPPGRPPFTTRESRIVHIVLSEVPWIYSTKEATLVGAGICQLSPRQRITLNLLLEGFTRKQIAIYLEISYHTVDSYIKEVYRRFSVHSQPDLIARFRCGDGGDLPDTEQLSLV